jgi:hypothetical protein
MIAVVVVAAVLIAIMLRSTGNAPTDQRGRKETAQKKANPAARVPAHFEEVKSLANLPPTLPPERFFGSARQAYQVAKEIPETLAQLPCYCYCDESFGHKSLHSCYETDHSSQCAVCVSEALLAYRLQKEQGLTPPQIRQRIIAEFSRQ